MKALDDPSTNQQRPFHDIVASGGSSSSTLHQAGRGHFELDLEEIRDIVRSNQSRNSKISASGDIKLSVHLDKNSSYESHSNASFKLYSYRNSLPNFFLVPPDGLNMLNLSRSQSQVVQNDPELKSWPSRKTYKNSTIALLYQHEPTGYSVRDCLVDSANREGLVTSNLPINSKFRKDWDRLNRQQKNKFQVLYGSLSFGVCEGLNHVCSYLTMLSHPVDRILTVYHLCKFNSSQAFCHFSKMNITSKSLHQFIHSQGSSLFQKLLYYAHHCKLIGDDEVCLDDSKVTFLLSASEKQIHLDRILAHLEEWFSVIGLTNHLEESLRLFDAVYDLRLAQCNNFARFNIPAIDGVPYTKIREQLLNNTQVMKWLAADLAIYKKLEEIFLKQLENHSIVPPKVTKDNRKTTPPDDTHSHIKHNRRKHHAKNLDAEDGIVLDEALEKISQRESQLQTVHQKGGKKIKKKDTVHHLLPNRTSGLNIVQ